jgi:hypothetical protein
MIEIIENFANPIVIALTIAIVQMIKPYFQKIDTRFISLTVATVLILLMEFVVLDESVLLTVENIVTVILPSFGFDYVLHPIYVSIIKPIIDLLTPKE